LSETGLPSAASLLGRNETAQDVAGAQLQTHHQAVPARRQSRPAAHIQADQFVHSARKGRITMLTRSWTERPFAVLDTETTDVNPYTAHIVQLALVLVAPDGGILEAHNAIINPGVPIPQTASAVHGIDDAAVKEHGAHPLPVLKNLSMMLSGLAHMGWPLV